MNIEEFAEQIVLFDQYLLRKIVKYDLYLQHKNGTLDHYVSCLASLEDVFIEILCKKPTKKDIQLMIKLCRMCYKIGNFNISYLLFSCLSHCSIVCNSVWKTIEKKYSQRFDKLQEMYSIVRNHHNYRVKFEEKI